MLVVVAMAASPATAQTAPVELRILAINDFHGYLQPPPGGIGIDDPADKADKITVAAGGAEHMATAVRQLREGHKNNIFVAAGDLIGASPFLSAMFHDEPTIESLDMMGLAVAAVGNHEFDEGKDELLRMQHGGCHPIDGCQGPHPFLGARFRYLAASTFEKSTGKTVLPAYEIREFGGIPVAFIGLTLKGTPNLVSPTGVADLEFRDEADTVNALVPELKARGVEAIVVLIHEGGFPAGDYNECPGISGPIVDIVRKFASRGRCGGQRPYPSRLCLRHRRPAGHLRRQIRHRRHRNRSEARPRQPRRRQRPGRQCHRPHRRLCAGTRNRPRCCKPMTGWPPRSPAGRRGRSPKRCRARPTRPARACSAISSPTPSWPRHRPKPTVAP